MGWGGAAAAVACERGATSRPAALPALPLSRAAQVNITACFLACVGAAVLTESPLSAIQVRAPAE